MINSLFSYLARCTIARICLHPSRKYIYITMIFAVVPNLKAR